MMSAKRRVLAALGGTAIAAGMALGPSAAALAAPSASASSTVISAQSDDMQFIQADGIWVFKGFYTDSATCQTLAQDYGRQGLYANCKKVFDVNTGTVSGYNLWVWYTF
jgi:hypothetical protein